MIKEINDFKGDYLVIKMGIIQEVQIAIYHVVASIIHRSKISNGLGNF